MARTKQTRASAAPGAGTMFALRAIGLVILARWLFSIGDMEPLTALQAMASSPWACINLVFLFLLIFLPGLFVVPEIGGNNLFFTRIISNSHRSFLKVGVYWKPPLVAASPRSCLIFSS